MLGPEAENVYFSLMSTEQMVHKARSLVRDNTEDDYFTDHADDGGNLMDERREPEEPYIRREPEPAPRNDSDRLLLADRDERQAAADRVEPRRKWEAERSRETRQATLHHILAYQTGGDLDAFLTRFEEHLSRAGVAPECWVGLLCGAVPAQLADYMTSGLSEETLEDYTETKIALLHHQGYNLPYYLRYLFDGQTFPANAVDMARCIKAALQYPTYSLVTLDNALNCLLKYAVLNEL